jgi:flagellar motor component MotA
MWLSMCNYCECENEQLCSIKGQIPTGFCCPKCNFYIDGTTCERLREKVQKRVETHREEIQEAQEILEKYKISDEKLGKYP